MRIFSSNTSDFQPSLVFLTNTHWPNLRRLNIEAFQWYRSSPSQIFTEFLNRHPKLEVLSLFGSGAIPISAALTLPKLKALSLSWHHNRFLETDSLAYNAFPDSLAVNLEHFGGIIVVEDIRNGFIDNLSNLRSCQVVAPIKSLSKIVASLPNIEHLEYSILDETLCVCVHLFLK